MEVTAPNSVKIEAPDEQIYELIKLIRHKYDNSCHFLRGPMWRTGKRTYNEKLVNSQFHLVNHHIYEVQKNDDIKLVKTYWRVSGRGNVNPITRTEAIEIIDKRTDYVEDSDLWEVPADDSGAIPYNPSCDW